MSNETFMTVWGYFLIPLNILIFGFLFYLIASTIKRNKKLLDKLKNAKQKYNETSSYACSNQMKKSIIGIIAVLLPCIIFSFIMNEIWLAIVVSGAMTIFVVVSMTGPKEIKLEKNILTITVNEEKYYDINNIKDIKYSITKSGKSTHMSLYIKDNENYEPYSIKQHTFMDIEVLVYLIMFLKNNELAKVDDLTITNIKELRKIYDIKYNYDLVK